MPDLPPLIVFSDDWGRHPSSCQHLVSRLLPHRQVTWVNTIGTRPPRLNWSTVKRSAEKLRQWTGLQYKPNTASQDERSSSGIETANPRVLNPTMWPSFRSPLARRLNRWLLTRTVKAIAEATALSPVVVTTLPITADLVGRFPARRWVYYCVDDFSVWPGLDGRTLQTMEVDLVKRVDAIITVSENLQEKMATLGRSARLLTHGVDLDFWRKPIDKTHEPKWSSDVRKMGQPLIVFWGVIDRRLDLEFVRTLGESLEEGVILFVGPRDNPEAELAQVPRVQFLPALRYEDLPSLADRSHLFIAPYADLPVTRAMQPLKLKEYLATGKPVVVRKLPATAEWADCADLVDTPVAFAATVMERLKSGVPEDQKDARKRLDLESWNAKAKLFEKWIGED